MNNDISHAVQAELDALNERVTALEGGTASNELPEEEDKPGQGPKPEDLPYDPDKPVETVSKSTRSRS